jgi:hypothetical protein
MKRQYLDISVSIGKESGTPPLSPRQHWLKSPHPQRTCVIFCVSPRKENRVPQLPCPCQLNMVAVGVR